MFKGATKSYSRAWDIHFIPYYTTYKKDLKVHSLDYALFMNLGLRKIRLNLLIKRLATSRSLGGPRTELFE